MAPIDCSDQPTWKSATPEKVQKYNQQEVSPAWDMEEVAVIVSEALRAWKDHVERRLLHESKQLPLQKAGRHSKYGGFSRKVVLRQTGEGSNNNAGEVRPPKTRSIKSKESTHNRLMQQRHLLPGSELCHDYLVNWNWNFSPCGRAKMVLQKKATDADCVLLECPRKVANSTNRWHQDEWKKTYLRGWSNYITFIMWRVQCGARRCAIWYIGNSSLVVVEFSRFRACISSASIASRGWLATTCS